MSRKPRFFCDNCGVEVDRGAKACPHCGRFFASVRCPSCGYADEEQAFAGGCPSCGYSAPPFKDRGPSIEQKVPAGPLPFWVYIFSIVALIGVFTILFFVVSR
ncbi:MAG: zinc ribbon domain-containing protein [Treponema sp.]|nr:zinc ribbon domain-containing protein [Treponema sp.]